MPNRGGDAEDDAYPSKERAWETAGPWATLDKSNDATAKQ